MGNIQYVNIDMRRTGMQLKRRITDAGYTVKDIQEWLHLSYPQSIYRWFQGQILPSIDHLYMLSKVLGIHMEDLIVPKQLFNWKTLLYEDKRMVVYWEKIENVK